MEKITLYIPNISCNHCVMTIKNELSEIKGIVSVEGDSQNKTLVVEYEEPASLQKIKDTLKEINYPSA